MNGERILLIDESSALRKMISAYLTQIGWTVDEADSLEYAQGRITAARPDLVVIALEFGADEVQDLIEELDQIGIDTCVTADSSRVQDRIACLERGAVDFMSKPLDLRELALRLKRRRRDRLPSTLPLNMEMPCGHAILDIASRVLRGASARPVSLTPSEFRLLYLLLCSEGGIVERSSISRDVLGHTGTNLSRSVDVMVSKLRRKLGLAGSGRFVRNVRSEGYVLARDERQSVRKAELAETGPAYASEP